MEYIFEDPREGKIDTGLWIKLFKSFGELGNREKAFELHKMLWGFRALGTELRITKDGLKLMPMIKPHGIWDDEKEFEESKQRLRPFITEIRFLFDRVMTI